MLSFLQTVTANHGRLLTDYQLIRVQSHIDAILLTDRAVLVFGRERAATEAAAVALADFHAGCREVPVLPIVLVTGERVLAQRPLPLTGAARPIVCTRLQMPGLLTQIASFPAVPGFKPAEWEDAAYRPVPGLIDAACRLYAGHDVAALLVTSSGRGDLAQTQMAIRTAIDRARAAGWKQLIFVTGAPGAGKTLCGLDLCVIRCMAITDSV